eukprot:7382886-Prymnesium_polylepis.1
MQPPRRFRRGRGVRRADAGPLMSMRKGRLESAKPLRAPTRSSDPGPLPYFISPSKVDAASGELRETPVVWCGAARAGGKNAPRPRRHAAASPQGASLANGNAWARWRRVARGPRTLG